MMKIHGLFGNLLMVSKHFAVKIVILKVLHIILEYKNVSVNNFFTWTAENLNKVLPKAKWD